jgi:hypothetical protein
MSFVRVGVASSTKSVVDEVKTLQGKSTNAEKSYLVGL